MFSRGGISRSGVAERTVGSRRAMNAPKSRDPCPTYDPYAEDVRRDPYPFYKGLREQCPVHHLDRFDLYSLSRFEAVVEVLRQRDRYTNAQGPGPEPFLEIAEMGLQALANADEPLHARQRKLVNWAFTPRRVNELEPKIEAISNALINEFCQRGTAEFVSEYAFQLPINVSAELYGVPPEDREKLKEWTLRLVDGLRGDAQSMGGAVESLLEFGGYVIEKATQRREMLEAGAEPPDDLLTALVKAEVDGERLDDMELVMISMQVLNGGESSIGMIANTVYLLCTHPKEMAKVRSRPELVENVVEEVLRYEAPIQGLCRTTLEDVEHHGVAIAKGSRVCALFASANRDPEHWGEDADEFRVDRDIKELRQHLSFGFGIHFCLGAPLARLEGKVALRHILERLPDLELDDAEVRRLRDDPLFFRGWHTMPIRFTPTEVRQ
jgi:cytochrome P450